MTVEGAAPGRAQTLRSDLGDEAVQSWRVSLNLDALTQIETPDGARISTARGVPLAGHHLDLEIPGRGAPLRLHLDTAYEGYAGVITYAGVIESDDGSLVAISVDGDEILGKIHHTEGFTYLIENAPNEREYTLSVIDQTLMPRGHDVHEGLQSPESGEQDSGQELPDTGKSVVQPMSSSGNVRLLVLFTPAVTAQTNITLLANNIVSSFNQSLSLSGVASSNYLTLADLRSIGNNLATPGRRCREDIAENMAEHKHEFTNLDAWMEVAYADIGLTIMTTEPGYTSDCHPQYGRFGGVAWVIPSGDYPNHPHPFANTTHTFAMGDLTALHEIGHVLNGRHEFDCIVGTTPSYACGYAPSHCQWMTMMGGYWPCTYDFVKPPEQQPTVRIARWSNPNPAYNYSGESTGVSGAGPTGRNMAAALNINMPLAAGWKGAQAPPPSAPNPITAASQYCWGINYVQWTTQSGTVEYRLFQSDSPGFTSPSLVYSGSGTATFVNVGGTAYLRARACNSGGCSAYSSQVTVTYYPACA